MQLRVCFHFHAYQPGDIVLRRPGGPFTPPEYVERRSPVSLRIGDQEVKGGNWTEAMLRFYGSVWKLFAEMAAEIPSGGPFCSVDIEPSTLQLLAEKEPASFGAFRELVRAGTLDPVATVPFHALIPHAAPEEQRLLSRLTFRLHDALYRRLQPPSVALGFWFPESLYSERAGRNAVQSFIESELEAARLGASRRRLFFIMDQAQFIGLSLPQAAHSLNFAMIESEKVAVFGRHRRLSDRWAFKHGTVEQLAGDAVASCTDGPKEGCNVPYALTMASDLESLAGSADQAERFCALRRALEGAGAKMLSHSAFLAKKLSGEYPMWKGELESKEFMLRLRDFSSWSDYLDQGVDYSSDTRWTGLHRWDGLVISRHYKRGPLSQIWKQGLMKVQDRLSAFISRGVYEALDHCLTPGRQNEQMCRSFLLGYSDVVFASLLRASGSVGPEGPAQVRQLIAGTIPSCRQEEAAALAARAYHEMLMSNRSDPRFWDHLDTRVTFQDIALLAHSLLDLSEVCGRLGLKDRASEAVKLYLSNLVNFHEAYRYYNLSSLFGAYGWEVSEDAWHMALSSEVPDRSGYDVVKRAALFVAMKEGSEPALKVLSESNFDHGQVVADCGHIEGEMHGGWENMEFCENRPI